VDRAIVEDEPALRQAQEALRRGRVSVRSDGRSLRERR
jgi:hypothetical protein